VTRLPMMKSVATLLCFISATLAQEYTLYHRIFDPSLGSPPPFTPRGTISLPSSSSSDATLVPHQGSAPSFATLYAEPHTLYQVALERPGDESEEDWSLASAKACHLSSTTSDRISLLLGADDVPYGVDYHLFGVPRTGACPVSIRSGSAAITNTTIALKRPIALPTVALRVPPPLTPEGQPVVPPPEKSLFQKYWIYGIPIILIFLMTAGDEEPAAKK